MSIDNTPTNLIAEAEAGGRWLVQNLGEADIYLARTEAGCTELEGVRISQSEALSIDFPLRTWTGGVGLWVRAAGEGTADVRVLQVG